jgi:hypothetical protein
MIRFQSLVFYSCLALFPAILSAQVSINAGDFPAKGDTVRYSNSSSFTANFTNTGPNYLWDFSDLTAQSQTLVNHADPDLADAFTQSLFGSTVLPTYRATYFLPANELPIATLSTFVDVPIEGINRFYKKTNQEITVVGLSIAASGFAIGKRADTIEVAYKFPMTFGQTYESKGFVNLDLSAVAPFSLKQYRQRVSEVDGWGMITTPYGTFDCLRIHHIISELDSVYIDAGNGPEWFPIDIPTIHEYEWWTKNQKGPILKAKANEIFGFMAINEVLFRDNFRPELNVGLAEDKENTVVLFPNPFETNFSLNGANNHSPIFIFDTTGKKMLEFQYKDRDIVNQLPTGTYVLLIKNNETFSQPVRFIKK